jgi:PAS domain S-box-containing protein
VRLTLFKRMTLAFAGIAALSVALALAIVDRSLALDLERAARDRLEAAKGAANEVVDLYLALASRRYGMLPVEPRLRAVLDDRDRPTLEFLANELLGELGASRIIFFDRGGAVIGAAGEAGLDALAAGEEPAALVAAQGRPFVAVRVPLETPGGFAGRLVAIEPVSAATIERWSALCRAPIEFVPEGAADPGGGRSIAAVARRLGGIEMRVALGMEAERDALARARWRLLASALASLFAAVLASLRLSHGLTNSIRGIKEAAARIGGGDFSARTGVARRDEIGDVARAVDEMAVRLEESRSRLEAILERLPYAVLLLEGEGARSVRYVNLAFEEITGTPRAEAIGADPRRFVRHEDAFAPGMWSALARGEPWTRRSTERRRDGAAYEQEVTVSTVRGLPGAALGYVAVLRDTTKEVALEAQFRQAQKMEAVGRLAGGVAHDFNNLLTAILGYSQILLGELAREAPMRAELEQIFDAGRRAAALTKQLLAFSRKQVLEPRVLDLNALVRDMDSMLRRLIGEDVELVIDLAPALAAVRADPGQTEQVVMNLAVNARDAMPRGGRLTIATANAALDEARAAELGARPGAWVTLAVLDTGSGMDAETRRHLFEPFFTTKAPGKGTGLGLSTVYGIVEQSGGRIAVESEPGRGSAFTIFLPAAEGAPAPAEPRPAPPCTARGTETILVVEDEDAVRELARRTLAAAGYAVLAARHGPEAIVACERHEGPIHLLLTDVVMPHMSGGELAERLAALRPHMKVLFMSGYSESGSFTRRMLERPGGFLGKPFTAEALAARVREVLDQGRGAAAAVTSGRAPAAPGA